MPARHLGWRAALISLLLLAALLMVWHFATLPQESAASAAQDEYARLMGKSSGAAKRDGFPGLAQMGETIRKELANPFYDNGPNDKGIGIQLAYSLGRVGLGFAIAAVVAIPLGFLLGMSPTAEFVLSPYILALQIAPKVAFAPLFVIWFGYTVYPKILVAVLIVFFPVMVNVLGAVRSIDPDIVRLAKSFTASRFQIFRMIEFPASLGPLFAGLRIAATLAVIGVVVGELVGGNTGLGYLLTFGEGAGNTAMVFVSIIMLTIIGIVLYGAIVLIENRVLHFMPARDRRSA